MEQVNYIYFSRMPKANNQLPKFGPPNGYIAKFNKNTNELQQVRRYDKNGESDTDYDFRQQSHLQETLHVHRYKKKGILAPHKTDRGAAEELNNDDMEFVSKNGLSRELTYSQFVEGQLHDETIESIETNDAQRTVTVKTTKFIVHFTGVSHVELHDFSLDNIIFEVSTYNMANAPKWIKRKFRVTQSEKIVHIDSSLGCNGFIICSDVRYNKRRRKNK